MFRFIASALLVAVISITLPGCFDKITNAQDSSRNGMGIKNPVTIKIDYSNTVYYFYVYSSGQLAYTNAMAVNIPDSVIVPDSARLDAYWGSNHRDTIATPGLVWHIGS